MEQESTNNGAFAELPQPQEVKGANKQEAASVEQPERRGAQMPSTSPSAQSQQPLVQADAQQMQPPTPAADDVPQSAAGSSALMADDTDLIEKEWVIKAKAIVAQTKDDPHQQNREMNKVKADYLKKRYNKDLKLNEG